MNRADLDASISRYTVYYRSLTRQPTRDDRGDVVLRQCACVDKTVYFPVLRRGIVSYYPAFKCIAFRCEASGC